MEKILVLIGAAILVAILMALPVMLLWNWLMPGLFDLVIINFWQALGVSLLSSFLFKSNSTSKD